MTIDPASILSAEWGDEEHTSVKVITQQGDEEWTSWVPSDPGNADWIMLNNMLAQPKDGDAAFSFKDYAGDSQ